MRDAERIISMSIAGPAAEGGLVPLRIISRKLEALQKTLFAIAEARGGGPVARRGNWTKYVRSSCELLFLESHKGSLTVCAELPPPHAMEQMTFFPDDEKDPGVKALQDLKDVSQAVVTGNEMKIMEILPDSIGRIRFLRSLEELCPREGDEFEISLGNGKGECYAVFGPESRNFIRNLFLERIEEEAPEIITIHGTLVEIRAFAGRRQISVKSRNREITCFYPTEMEEEIAQLVVGSIVEVSGTAQTNDDGSVLQIDRISNVSTVDLSPFRIKAFVWQGGRYILKEPVMTNLDYEGDLWVYKIPRYALHAFSPDRRDALSQLHEHFAFACDDLLHESDENLTLDAIELRDRLKADIEDIKEAG
ncbi:MAG: hypothetical protein AB2L14_25135 [Candidatus Xenobiia bacterium LiM19]